MLTTLPNAPQIKKESDVMVIDSAKGDTFDAFYKAKAQEARRETEREVVKDEVKSLLNPLFDGSASWFT